MNIFVAFLGQKNFKASNSGKRTAGWAKTLVFNFGGKGIFYSIPLTNKGNLGLNYFFHFDFFKGLSFFQIFFNKLVFKFGNIV